MCSTFTMQKKESVLLGQNYDFYYGHGLIVVSPRGFKKVSVVKPGQKETAWTANYGNVTFTQFGRELPMGGMNERGLTIAMMWHEEGQYPSADDRPVLNELQWIQYQLDQYGTVQEVVEHLDEIRIEQSMYVLHYHGNGEIRTFSIRSFSFSKSEPVLCLEVDNSLQGDVEASFRPYTRVDNERIIAISYRPIIELFPLEEQQELATFPERFE